MKKVGLLVLTALFASEFTIAQTYKIDTAQISFENKLRPCFEVHYDAEAKNVKKAWSNFFKKNYKIKIKGVGLFSDKDLISAEDVTMAAVSDKRMNLYARIIDEAGGAELKYFMSFGYDFFIGYDNYSGEFSKMKGILNDFSVTFLNDYYADRARQITQSVKKLEREKKSKLSTIKKNNKKAKKESSTVALGLEAKNNSLEMEIEEIERKIDQYADELNKIKEKQSGITRN